MNEARRPNPVKINISATGHGTVEIGGQQFESYTSALTIVSRPGELTKIYLEVVAADGLQAQLDALVDVVIRDPLAEAKAST